MRDSGVKMVYLTSVDDKIGGALRQGDEVPRLQARRCSSSNGSGYDADVLALAGDAAEGMFVTASTALYGGEDSARRPGSRADEQVDPERQARLQTRHLRRLRVGVGPVAVRGDGDRSVPSRRAPRSTPRSARSGPFDELRLVRAVEPRAKQPAPCFILAKVVGGKYVRFDSPTSGFRCDDGPWFFG